MNRNDNESGPPLRRKESLEMTARIDRIHDPRRPKSAPSEYAGQWVAWNRDRNEIIAHGSDVAQVRAAAVAAGQPDALLEKVSHSDHIFVGCV